jgi:hypothetical protein
MLRFTATPDAVESLGTEAIAFCVVAQGFSSAQHSSAG